MTTQKKRNKRNKSTKPATAKQLKARRKFVRMVRARAKEARAAKRLAARNGRSAVSGRRRATAKKANRRNPGVIRFSEADARRYGGKIKGFGGSGASRTSGGRKKRGRKFKKAGVFGGSGFLGLGRSRKTVRVRRNSATCTKNGKKLYGAAAQAVLKARGKRNGKAKRVKVGNKGFWRGHVKRAVSKRLHMPIRLGKRRRNQTPAGVAAMHQTFLGEPVKSTKAIAAPDGTPRDVAVIGQIVELKSETETFNFKPGEAPLGANARGDLFVLGRTKVESNTDFGKLLELSYVAKKDHLNGKLTEYFHVFGEEGGRPPKLRTDREGMFHIVGGSYSIEAEGITD